MSGTSLDATDGVLIEWLPTTDTQLNFKLLGQASQPISGQWRSTLLQLNSAGSNELHLSALAANALAIDATKVVHALLQQSGLAASAVAAVGLHGQTVRHQPRLHDGCGYTLQLHNASLLAEQCGIDVITDFRSRDVAAGGQGAPLVPAFHAALVGQQECVAVLNIGGFANLSLLHSATQVSGLDTGPGNVLLDAWCQRHLGTAFDFNGQWAASGSVIPDLLELLLQHPYFSLPAPKSTGRDDFYLQWLDQQLNRFTQIHSVINPPEDVQATLTELTAQTISSTLKQAMPQCKQLWVCGGGALNSYLMTRLQVACHRVGMPIAVQPTPSLGLGVMEVEAAAFAWLALQHLRRQPGNCPAVTGAHGPRILGCWYPR